MQLLKFYASWCGPCKNLAKTMENIEFPYEVVPVDLDENMDLALTYAVRTVPTLILVGAEGEVIARLSDSTATPQKLTSTFVTPYE